jgi:hypothetical protein
MIRKVLCFFGFYKRDYNALPRFFGTLGTCKYCSKGIIL